nr:DUF5067 domain-containing protein [Fructobacillus papyriferae]
MALITIFAIGFATYVANNDGQLPTFCKSKTSNKWHFRGNTYYAGKLNTTFTSGEIIDGMNGTKVFILHGKMTNVSKEEADASAMYAVVHAYQKTNSTNQKLDPGVPAVNDDFSVPYQTESDNLNQKVLPGKTVPVVLEYTLVNNNPINVTFEDAKFNKVGSKSYKIKM